MREIFEKILEGTDVRANLIKLKDLLKDDKNRSAFMYNFADKKNTFADLLKNEDPKIRKNSAVIMGLLHDKEFLEPLYNAYNEENTLFVKSEYLDAISNFNYAQYVDAFKKRLSHLRKSEIAENDKKHVNEEMRKLNELIIMFSGSKKHEFTGFNRKPDMLLLTNRNYAQATADLIPESTVFNAGVMVKKDTVSIEEVLKIRTFSEILFTVEGMKVIEPDYRVAARQIADSDIWVFLKKMYGNIDEPFNFRIELKDKLDPSKKGKYIKSLSTEIESLSNYRLINSASDYEIEIRLIKNKTGRYNCLVKLYSFADNRFEYRQNVVAESIKPYNAAMFMELSKKYLKPEAKVLDPFCGVGTMLIERYYFLKTNTMYGIDNKESTVEMAKLNTSYAHQIIHYINRDFFDFKHEYLFDEIITNMPMEINSVKSKEIKNIYNRFFDKAAEHLENSGIVVMYTHDLELVLKYFKEKFNMLEKFEISKKEQSYLIVLQKK